MSATRYTEDHEWVRLDGDVATVGISNHAQEQLGDVVFVDLPEIGRKVARKEALAVVELEFPKFCDGRAYSNARILRERYAFKGELRAVGDVLMEQLHFMLRTGFNAFEIAGPDPLKQYRTAKAEFSVWYQPTGDGRPTAISLRHRAALDRGNH